jgi:hypothetical protein
VGVANGVGAGAGADAGVGVGVGVGVEVRAGLMLALKWGQDLFLELVLENGLASALVLERG